MGTVIALPAIVQSFVSPDQWLNFQFCDAAARGAADTVASVPYGYHVSPTGETVPPVFAHAVRRISDASQYQHTAYVELDTTENTAFVPLPSTMFSSSKSSRQVADHPVTAQTIPWV